MASEFLKEVIEQEIRINSGFYDFRQLVKQGLIFGCLQSLSSVFVPPKLEECLKLILKILIYWRIVVESLEHAEERLELGLLV